MGMALEGSLKYLYQLLQQAVASKMPGWNDLQGSFFHDWGPKKSKLVGIM